MCRTRPPPIQGSRSSSSSAHRRSQTSMPHLGTRQRSPEASAARPNSEEGRAAQQLAGCKRRDRPESQSTVAERNVLAALAISTTLRRPIQAGCRARPTWGPLLACPLLLELVPLLWSCDGLRWLAGSALEKWSSALVILGLQS